MGFQTFGSLQSEAQITLKDRKAEPSHCGKPEEQVMMKKDAIK
jgi:hypothetical protein